MGGVVTKKDKSVGPFFPIIIQNGLVIKVLGGFIDRQNEPIEIAATALTLDANETNFVYVDGLTDTIDFDSSISAFPITSKPLYKITTDAIGIIATEDFRAVIRVATHSEYKTKDGSLIYDVLNENKDWTLADLSAYAPDCATALFLNVAVNDTGTPSSDVYASFRKPGESGLGREATIYPQVSGIYCSGTAVIGMDALKQIEYKVNVSGTFTLFSTLAGWLFGRC